MFVSILYVGLIILNIYFGYKKIRNRECIVVSVILMIILMAYNSGGADIITYRAFYNYALNGVDVQFPEQGYNLVQKIGTLFDMDFYTWRLCVVIVCFLLIKSTLDEFDVNPHIVITFYMSYSFFMDTIQMRNFMAVAIICYSFKYYCRGGIKNSILFTLLIITASLFHKVAIFYLLLLLYKNKEMKKINKLVFVVMLLAFVFFAINNSMLSLLANFMSRFMDERGGYIIARTRFSFIPIVILQLSYYFVSKKIYKMNINMDSEHNNNFSRCVYEINNVVIWGFPLLLFSFLFYRIIRNILILNYINLAIFIEAKEKKSSIRLKYLLVGLVLTVLWFILDFGMINNFENTIEPIFKDNYFLYGLK